MKIARLFGIVLSVVFAVCASLASLASAADPEFTHLPTVKTFKTASTGNSILRGTTATVTCTSEGGSGEITSMDEVGKVSVVYNGCTVATAEHSGCSISSKTSPASGAGEIKVEPLRGLLGLVATAEATSGVGILFEPESSSGVFVTFEKSAGECSTPVTKVEGSVAGEVPLINHLLRTARTIFLAVGGTTAQKIKTIKTLNGEVKPKLLSFGSLPSSQEEEPVTTYGDELRID